jgi:hypothetical protein
MESCWQLIHLNLYNARVRGTQIIFAKANFLSRCSYRFVYKAGSFA